MTENLAKLELQSNFKLGKKRREEGEEKEVHNM